MVETHEIAAAWRGLSLAGTLSLPEGDGPHPAVVMLQGSGPADRESGGYFRPIRQAFIERGLATVAFDKPGCGQSSGDWHDFGLYDRADQASNVIDLVRRHPAIDPAQVGVWGHSQGGWLAQILADRHPDLAFAVANSGPSVDVADQNLYGCEHTMRAEGFAEAAIERAVELLRKLHLAAAQGRDHRDVERDLLRPVQGESWAGHVVDADAKEWDFLRLLIEENYQPRDALSQVRCPFLAIYGGQDPLVPAWKGAEESGRWLAEAGNETSAVVVFPTANHRIQGPSTERFVDGYLDLLSGWIGRWVRLSSSGGSSPG